MSHAKAALDRLFDAIEAKDASKIADAFADDVVIETEMLREPIRGKRMLEDLLGTALDAYESIRVERRKIVASGSEAAALVSARARFGRDLEMLGETLPTAGKEVEVLGAVFVDVNGAGKIQHLSRVRDTLGVAHQLGLPSDQMLRLAQKFQQQIEQRRAA